MTESVDLGIEGLSDFVEIGSGGFATVYSAFDHQFHRRVAVKTLHTASPDGQRRFERELNLMGRLGDHMNVVTPYRTGLTRTGTPFLVMEYLPGGSLEERVDADGALQLREAIDLILPVADALRTAHNAGILHRDVKPANIMLTADDVPKLSDFGISAVHEATATQRSFTLAHSPPETFDEVEARDERSDLYSLASSLHMLVGGQAPFRVPNESSPEARIGRIVSHPVPKLGHRALDDFVGVAMAKDPERRYQNAADFIAALSAVRENDPHVAYRLLPRANDGGSDDLNPDATNESDSSRTTIVDHGPPIAGPQTGVVGRRTDGAADDDHAGDFASDDADGRPSWLSGVGLASALAIVGVGGLLALNARDSTATSSTASPAASASQSAEQQQDQATATEREPTAQTTSDEASASSTTVGGSEVFEAIDAAPQTMVFEGHRDFVEQVLVLPDDRILSASSDGALMMWEPAAPGTEPIVFGGSAGTVFDLVRMPDGRIATGSNGGLVSVWDPAAPSSGPLRFTSQGGVADLEVLFDGRVVIAGAEVEVWDPSLPSAPPISFVEHGTGVGEVEALSDARVASAGIDGKVMVWQPDEMWDEPVVFTGHTGAILDMLVLPDGRLATAGVDSTVRLWDPDDQDAEPVVLSGHTNNVNDLEVLTDGRLASGSSDGTIRVWDPTAADEAPIVFKGHSSAVWVIAALSDGRLASASGDASLQVWDPADPGTPPIPLSGHTNGISSLATLGDGRLVSGSHDQTIRVWATS